MGSLFRVRTMALFVILCFAFGVLFASGESGFFFQHDDLCLRLVFSFFTMIICIVKDSFIIKVNFSLLCHGIAMPTLG